MATTSTSISSVVQQWADAELAGDVQALTRLLHPEFVGVGPLGFMLPKDAWLQRVGAGMLHYTAFSLDEIQMRQFAASAIVIAALTQNGTFQERDISARFRVTLILEQVDNGWQIAGLQLSTIQPAPSTPA